MAELDGRRSACRWAPSTTACACFLVTSAFSLGCRQQVDEGTAFISSSGAAESSDSSADGTGTEGGDGGFEGGEDGGDGSTGTGDDAGSEGGLPDVADSTGTGSTGSGTTAGGTCGNGAIDMGEQCDLANLNGFTCEQLGYGSGALDCDPMTCTYDTSQCVPDMGGTSG